LAAASRPLRRSAARLSGAWACSATWFTTTLSDMIMFLWLSRSSDNSYKQCKAVLKWRMRKWLQMKTTYSKVLNSIFQLFHVVRNAFVSPELIFGVLKPTFQSPQVQLLLSPRFPGTQWTWSMRLMLTMSPIKGQRWWRRIMPTTQDERHTSNRANAEPLWDRREMKRETKSSKRAQ
jgi:hypothetical protein